jgi:hypothetical protein
MAKGLRSKKCIFLQDYVWQQLQGNYFGERRVSKRKHINFAVDLDEMGRGNKNRTGPVHDKVQLRSSQTGLTAVNNMSAQEYVTHACHMRYRHIGCLCHSV